MIGMRRRATNLWMMAAMAVGLLAGGMALASGGGAVEAQAPPAVPVVRFFGSVTINGQPAPTGTSITAQSVTSASTTCGNGSVTGPGQYQIDIQSIAGCTGNVVFIINGQKATQIGTPPALQGSAMQLNLTVTTATATPTPPPAPRIVTTPPAAPTLPPARTPSPVPTLPPTASPTVAPVVVPVAAPNTGVGPGPSRGVVQGPASVQAPAKAAPAAASRAPAAVSQAPVSAAPQLPNTGSGGLLGTGNASSLSLWPLAALLLVASFASLAALATIRRGR